MPEREEVCSGGILVQKYKSIAFNYTWGIVLQIFSIQISRLNEETEFVNANSILFEFTQWEVYQLNLWTSELCTAVTIPFLQRRENSRRVDAKAHDINLLSQ